MEMNDVEDILKDILTALSDIKYEMSEYNHNIKHGKEHKFDLVLLEYTQVRFIRNLMEVIK